MLYQTFYNSPLGKLIIVANAKQVVCLNFVGQNNYLNKINVEIIKNDNLEIFELTKKWLELYFCSAIPDFNVPVLLNGTEFQKSVWDIISSVKYGQTISYSNIAKLLNKPPIAARAIGNAVSKNPILLIVPCHRVINSNGVIGGYAAGVERKKSLLELESSNSLSKSIIAF